MYATNGNATRVRWEVRWIAKGRVQAKGFDHDLSSALELYVKVVRAGRSGATLRSCNMGFPPPDDYADREEVIVIKNGRKFKAKRIITPRVYQDRMREVNSRGVWWCPYCMKMRKFVKREFFMLEGIKVQEPSMNCPVCRVSHRDGSVVQYNPVATRYLDMRRTRSDKGKARG